ncbi:MAG: D-alanyl-D-alanine carboxypeptidase [Firmicutes bacterium]|nr:D-alanyl-D-alanine carboxypeptidase [Bacillota bacterium]
MLRKTRRQVLALCLMCIFLFASVAPSWAATVKRPAITAGGAVTYCQNTGEIIYAKNKNKRFAPYSTTKMMTALLAVQNLPLDQEVTVSERAVQEGEATMELQAGEVVTVKDLVYGTLILSGNDAAWALAEAVSGNVNKFVKLMNKTAKNIGCENTHFSNPNGMDEKDHYSTAYDMMLITKLALSNETIRTAAGTVKYKMDATNLSDKRVMKTHVPLIDKKDSGFYAGKTGYWDDNNCSIVLGYEENGLQLCVVVLDATKDEREKDVKKITEYTTKKVEGVKVVGKDAEEGKVRIKQGAKTRLKTYTAEVGYAYLPKEASESLIGTKIVMFNDVTAPVKAGTVVGKYEIYVGEDLVNQVDLVIKEDVKKGWFTSYLGISNRAAVIIGVVLMLLLIARIWIGVESAKRKRRKMMERQRRIQEMAMQELEAERSRKERDWRF